MEHRYYIHLVETRICVSGCSHRLVQSFLSFTETEEKISNSLDTCFCLSALEKAFQNGVPEIFNSDQGSQFTSESFIKSLELSGTRISWDGRGRAMDNIFVERLWRSVKYEEVYLKDYANVPEAINGIDRYFKFYNTQRPHQSLGYKTPERVFFGNK